MKETQADKTPQAQKKSTCRRHKQASIDGEEREDFRIHDLQQ
jgi:hypothetical protein